MKEIDRPEADGSPEESPQGNLELPECADDGGNGDGDPVHQGFVHRDPVVRCGVENVEREKQSRGGEQIEEGKSLFIPRVRTGNRQHGAAHSGIFQNAVLLREGCPMAVFHGLSSDRRVYFFLEAAAACSFF